MRYFSEEIVRQIVKDAMEYGMSISQTQPMDIGHYPNIEIKEPHGRCIDADAFKSNLIRARYADNPNKEKTYNKALDILSDAPVIMGAST